MSATTDDILQLAKTAFPGLAVECDPLEDRHGVIDGAWVVYLRDGSTTFPESFPDVPAETIRAFWERLPPCDVHISAEDLSRHYDSCTVYDYPLTITLRLR